ncbi:uncharacterized protein [Amphiura filiformis]|uniref:uncharacterized protein n=1 Tax=Amphiura filiformis TaxID=82378 RepID=UPI003B225EE5
MTTRKLNFVHNDEIWKDHVRHELHSLRQWPKKWGYLTKEYNNLNKQLVGEPTTPDSSRSHIRRRGSSASVSSRRSTPRLTAKPVGNHLPNIASSSSAAVGSQERPKSARRLSAQIGRSSDSCQLPAISRRSESKSTATPTPKPEPSIQFMGTVAPHPPPLPPKFPYTTAGEVGWKSTLRENQLEVYGRYAPNARGQHGILKLLKWPQQGL